MSLLGRLLCRLGRHDSDYVVVWAFGATDVHCSRCGIRREDSR